MIKQALQKGTSLKCEIKQMKGRFYSVVDWDENDVYLVELDKVAEGVENLKPSDFWQVSPKYLAANFSVVENEAEAADNTPQALGVGSVVKYAQILDKGDEVSRFVIVQELADDKVEVAEITSRTAFGYSRYYRMKSEFVAVTDADELEAIAEQIKNDGEPLYLQYLDKLAEERKAREAAAPATLEQADEITEPKAEINEFFYYGEMGIIMPQYLTKAQTRKDKNGFLCNLAGEVLHNPVTGQILHEYPTKQARK